jgi:hypothetical protein
MDASEVEMPKYKSHKTVHALKILTITDTEDGRHWLLPAERGYAEFQVSDDWLSRCKADRADFGYYVLYEDGYASWSPTKAFEEGYTRIQG